MRFCKIFFRLYRFICFNCHYINYLCVMKFFKNILVKLSHFGARNKNFALFV